MPASCRSQPRLQHVYYLHVAEPIGFLELLPMMSSLFLATLLAGADPCISGTPIGQRPGPYSFLVATGAQRGQQTCYICEQADKPTAVVFTRVLTEPVGQLVAALDAETTKRKDSGYKVWLTQLAKKAELDELAKWAKNAGIKTAPVGAFEDEDGPPAYKLAQDAEVTVLLFVKQKVVANFAFRKGELNEKAMAKIAEALPKLFEK
jgi:hypothetical protein